MRNWPFGRLSIFECWHAALGGLKKAIVFQKVHVGWNIVCGRTSLSQFDEADVTRGMGTPSVV